MATQSIEFLAATGQTITAKLYAIGSDTEVASVTATEATNRKGRYVGAFTDVAAGAYELIGYNASSVPLCSWVVRLTLTTATFYAREPASTEYIADDTIRAAAFDEATAYPLASADSGATAIARTGADGDTLETISDQLDAVETLAASSLLHTTTIATLSSQTVFTLTAGSADDDAYNDATIIVIDQSTATQIAIGYVADYVGSTRMVKLLQAPGFTIATGDKVRLLTGMDTARVHVDAALTNAAGDAVHVAAWLEWRGARVSLSGDTITVAFRKLDADTNLFSVTESDLIGGASAAYDNTFRLAKATPGFTDDRIYLVTASIVHNGRTFVGTAVIPVLS